MFASADFWIGVSLVIFLGLALWMGLSQILGALDQRAERIRTEIEEAEKLREDAQKTLAEYKRKQRDALTEAEEIVQNADASAKRMRERAEKEAEESIQRREQQAMEKIEQAEAQAVAEVRHRAVEVATAAAAELIAKSIDKDKADEMVRESIDRLSKQLN